MFVIKNNIVQGIDPRNLQRYIDEGGYEFLDINNNPIDEKDLQAEADKEIEATSGHANTYEELVTQLKALGIQVKED